MESSIYRYIWRYSKRQQIIILMFTLTTFPLLYLSLEVPKIIINEALGGDMFPREVLGFEVEQVAFLLLLCVAYLVLVLINGVVKMRINIYKGIIAERMMRRLRYQLIDRVLRFPRPHFRKVSQGELIPIVTAEVEPLGELMGDALAQPLAQSGQMLTILIFLFVQNLWLGLAAVALIPLQAYVIPKLQRQVNLLHREKVKQVRGLSVKLSETVTGVHDIHLGATTAYTRSDFSNRLGGILRVRFQIYKKKFFMKFINNMINSLTPFFFYAIGGYLVIQGQLTLGALVAALSANKDLISPWKELLNFYNQFMDSSIRYEAIIEKFDPEGLMDADQQAIIPESIIRLDGVIQLSNVSWEDNGVRALRNVSMTIEGGSTVAVVGPDDAGRERLAQIISRTLSPRFGLVSIGGKPLQTIPEAVTGARIAYVGPDSHVFSGTIGDNVRLSLKRFPPRDFEVTAEIQAEVDEARAAGNSPHPFVVDWVDYKSSGFRDKDEFNEWWLSLFRVVRASDFLFERGLDVVIDPSHNPDLGAAIVKARHPVAMKLAGDDHLGALVRSFHPDEYNTYASVAENILYGEPTDQRLAPDNLSNEPYLKEVLEACGLTRRLQEISLKLVDMMLDMFKGLTPGHPFYERYSFMDEALLPVLKDIQMRAAAGIDKLNAEDLSMLTRGVYKLIPERHRLDLIDDDMEQALLRARRYFHDHLPNRLKDAVVPFSAEGYLPNTSVMTNALLGRIAFSEAGAERAVRSMVQAVFEELGLRKDIELLVGEFQTGIGGSMLPTPARERVALIRALSKRPDVIVLNQAMASFGDEQRIDIARDIRKVLPKSTMIWMDKSVAPGLHFDQIFEIRDSRVRILNGEPAEIAKPSAPPTGEAPVGGLKIELDRLAQVPLFSALSGSELKLIALASEKRVVGAGEILFSQGDRTDGVYTILDGELEIVLMIDDGERLLARLGRGDTVGELGVVCERPRSATARAAEETTLLFTTAEDVLTLLAHNSGAANAMLKYVGQRFADSVEQQIAV
ncbi:ABC transporter transmembrane domain-containing protein [Gammaproteobacteria bacterium]|nr:ABC transporter transmembrane domain-containing protein [Gammaproteobacteria bacterium]